MKGANYHLTNTASRRFSPPRSAGWLVAAALAALLTADAAFAATSIQVTGNGTFGGDGGEYSITRFDVNPGTVVFNAGTFNVNCTPWLKTSDITIGNGAYLDFKAQNVSCPSPSTKNIFTIQSGGTMVTTKTVAGRPGTFNIEAGGLFVQNGTFAFEAAGNTLDLYGTMTASNGVSVTKYDLAFTQHSGSTLILGGAMSTSATQGSKTFSYTVEGGTIKALQGAAISTTTSTIADNAAFTVDVAEYVTFDLSGVTTFGSGVAVTKTGDGTLKLPAGSGMSVTLSAGTLVVPDSVPAASVTYNASNYTVSTENGFTTYAPATAAVTAEWTGAGANGNWSTAANWIGAAPVAGDSALFDCAVNTSTVYDLSVAALDTLSFGANAGAFTIGGTGPLTLVTGVENNSPNVQTFSVPLTSAGDTMTLSGNGDFALNGAVTTTTLRKTGAGKLALASTPSGHVSMGGGTLDMGGASATFAQTTGAAPVLDDGVVLTNGTYSFTSSVVYNENSGFLPFSEGTLTIAHGATMTQTGVTFCYHNDAAGCGLRRLLVDGGTYIENGSPYIIGVDNDWSKPAILELRNGATFRQSNTGNTEFHVGARWSGQSTAKAAGIVSATDSTLDLTGQIILLNESSAGSRGIFAATNSTITTTRSNLPAVRINASGNAGSDAIMTLNHSTLESRRINVRARAYTGSAAIGRAYTGTLTLDGGVLRPLAADNQYIYNEDGAIVPSVELLSGGGVIDANYDVTVQAIIFGEGGLVKTGSGTLTLSAANTYTGATTVSNGTVILTGSLAGGIAVHGGTFQTAVGGSYPSLSIDGGTLTINTAAASFATVAVGASGGTLALGVNGCTFNGVTGTANFANLTLSAAPDAWLGGAALYSDNPDFLEWARGKLQGLLASGLTASVSGNAVMIETAIVAKTTTWTGGGSDALWSTDANWDVGAPNVGDTVVMDGSVNTATELAEVLSIPTLTFAPAAGSFSIDGAGSLAVSIAITNSSDAAQTVGVPVTLSGAASPIHAVGDIIFTNGLAATGIAKTGAGTMSLSKSYTGTLAIEEGGVALADASATLSTTPGDLAIAATLDLGGGSLTLAQDATDKPMLLDGAVLKNGTFTYSTTRPNGVMGETVVHWTNGTVTVGAGATFSFAGVLFDYAANAPAATYGARRFIIDGGTYTTTKNQYVIGVNNDWEKGAVVELRNGASLVATGAEFHIGARNSGGATSTKASGLLVANNSTLDLNQKLVVLNEGTGNPGSYGHVAITNSTLNVTHNNGVSLNDFSNSRSDSGIEVNHSTFAFKKMVANAMAYNGSQDIGRATTGVLTLDAGIVRALANATSSGGEFIRNNNNAAYPAVELLAGGGVFDTQSYSVAVPAVIYGVGGLTKTGSGTLILSGANTYAGATIVSNGTLRLTGAVAGAVEVADGATLALPIPDQGNVPEVASLTVADGGSLALVTAGLPEGATSVDLLVSDGEICIPQQTQDASHCTFSVKQRGNRTFLRYGKSIGLHIIVQ